jgi:methionyl-tRNA formyltransferase
MRIVYMGTPGFAVPPLVALIGAGHEIVAAYTQPPRPAGRGKQLMPSPVQREAEERSIPVHHPSTLKDLEAQAIFAGHEAEIGVVAAYGLILPQPILKAPTHGCLNIHASLLPRWRGAAPIQRAILAGDAVTGVTIMRMERGLDTGPMLATARVQIERQTAGELTGELSAEGARLIVEVLADLRAYPEVPQPALGATYADKVDKSEAKLDFARSAEQVERQVRAFAPAPGAWFALDDERFRVLAAEVVGREGIAGTTLDDKLTIACGFGAIRPTLIQRAGRPAMDVDALLRGRAIPAGTRLA